MLATVEGTLYLSPEHDTFIHIYPPNGVVESHLLAHSRDRYFGVDDRADWEIPCRHMTQNLQNQEIVTIRKLASALRVDNEFQLFEFAKSINSEGSGHSSLAKFTGLEEFVTVFLKDVYNSPYKSKALYMIFRNSEEIMASINAPIQGEAVRYRRAALDEGNDEWQFVREDMLDKISTKAFNQPVQQDEGDV